MNGQLLGLIGALCALWLTQAHADPPGTRADLGGIVDLHTGKVIPGSGSSAPPRPVFSGKLPSAGTAPKYVLPSGQPTSNNVGGARSLCGRAHDAMKLSFPKSANIDSSFCNDHDFLKAVEYNCDWIGWGSWEGTMGFFTRRSFLSHCNRFRQQDWDRYGHLYVLVPEGGCDPLVGGRRARRCEFTSSRLPTNAAFTSPFTGHPSLPYPLKVNDGSAYSYIREMEIRSQLDALRFQGRIPALVRPAGAGK